MQPNRAAALKPYLKDHLCTGHAFHHYLGVAGRCLAEYLGAYGGQIQQDCLQGVSVKEELVGWDTQGRCERKIKHTCAVLK